VSTERADVVRTVERTCRVIQRSGEACGRKYRVLPGSKAKGCPECCPRLDLYPDRSAA